MCDEYEFDQDFFMEGDGEIITLSEECYETLHDVLLALIEGNHLSEKANYVAEEALYNGVDSLSIGQMRYFQRHIVEEYYCMSCDECHEHIEHYDIVAWLSNGFLCSRCSSKEADPNSRLEEAYVSE